MYAHTLAENIEIAKHLQLPLKGKLIEFGCEDDLSETGLHTARPGGVEMHLAACPSFGCSSIAPSKGFLCIPKYTLQNGKYYDTTHTMEDTTLLGQLSKLKIIRYKNINKV